MEYVVRCGGQFEASHHIPGDPWCGRGDGHRYRVEVSAQASVNDSNLLTVNPNDLAEAVRRLLDVVDHTNLNEMIPASRTYLEDIAAWIMESLIGSHRTVLAVQIWQDEFTSVTATRELR